MPFADSFRDLIADKKQRETAEEIYRNPSVLTQKSLNRSALFLNTQTKGLPHTSPGQRPRWACGLKPAGQTRAKALATLFVAPRYNKAWIGARTVWHRFQPVFARRALARRNEAVGLIFALAYHDEILGQHPSQSYLKFRRSSNRRRTLYGGHHQNERRPLWREAARHRSERRCHLRQLAPRSSFHPEITDPLDPKRMG